MSQLLGPPMDSSTPNQVQAVDPCSDDLFMVDSTDESSSLTGDDPPMGLTENLSPTFLSTGNPCLDFFFHILPDTPKLDLIQRLKLAWNHNSLTTLKLICHLRGVRGTGKSDKEGFYVAALWLHKYHPKTLALNVNWFAQFGYLKDLLEILYRLLEGLNVRDISKKEMKDSVLYLKRGKRNERKETVTIWKKGKRERVERSRFKTTSTRRKRTTTATNSSDSVLADEMNSLNVVDVVQGEDKPKFPMQKKKSTADMAKKALQRYNADPNYQFLHDKISHLFAHMLVSDLNSLESKQYRNVSLASKWCPSLDSSYDRSTLICESIAKKVFPRDSDPQYQGIEEAHYAYRVRDLLRKQVLAPLRQALQLPEIYMSAKKWDSLPYERVASVAMKLYKRLFVEHDLERFTTHLDNVKKGKAKIAAGALLPHEILASLEKDYRSEEEDDDEQVREVAELQWRRMVEDLSVKGKLSNCLAICDVSGSMSGLPMQVCVALGLLISELSEDPWKGRLITFSESPTLQTIRGDTLQEKKSFVEDMDWGMNTDFQKVFDLILQVAVQGNLRDSDMIKRVFVFSDMEFDQASANDWETDYQAIQRKFNESSYSSAVPEIVFWNLRDSKSTPVAATQKGVALVSGYSKNLLNLFLDGDGPLNPEIIMKSAISGEEYNKLHVYD